MKCSKGSDGIPWGAKRFSSDIGRRFTRNTRSAPRLPANHGTCNGSGGTDTGTSWTLVRGAVGGRIGGQSGRGVGRPRETPLILSYGQWARSVFIAASPTRKPTTSQDGGKEVTEIAISRANYKPLYIRERIDGVIARGTGVRVLTVETLPRQPALFAHHVTEVGPGLTGTPLSSGGTRTTLRAARAAMNPDPVVPAGRIAGLRRTWVGLPDYLVPPYNSYRDQVGGVNLYYGHLDYAGYPTYKGSYVSITEIPSRKAIVALWGVGLFQQDAAIVIDSKTATMKTHGLYLLIHASSRAQALEAARVLAP